MSNARLLERRPVYEGRVVNLSVDRVELPNGRETTLEMIRHPGAAAVVPLDADGSVHLVRQYRYATGDWIFEVPAGKLDGGEEPQACAVREVEEEIGLVPGRLADLGWIWTTPGFTDEKIWLYLATELGPGRQTLQENEVLSVVNMPFEEAVRLAATGEIRDGKSICALLRAAHLVR
jgi:ADP-ribose pyrophosphatase